MRPGDSPCRDSLRSISALWLSRRVAHTFPPHRSIHPNPSARWPAHFANSPALSLSLSWLHTGPPAPSEGSRHSAGLSPPAPAAAPVCQSPPSRGPLALTTRKLNLDSPTSESCCRCSLAPSLSFVRIPPNVFAFHRASRDSRTPCS